MTRELLSIIIHEYGNDLFEGEANQRWKSSDEVAEYIITLMEHSND